MLGVAIKVHRQFIVVHFHRNITSCAICLCRERKTVLRTGWDQREFLLILKETHHPIVSSTQQDENVNCCGLLVHRQLQEGL